MRFVQRLSILAAFGVFSFFAFLIFSNATGRSIASKATPTPTPSYDQAAEIAKIKESIKGKEKLPAGEVFSNVKDFARIPAGRLLAVMEFGYARSLGVDCRHCHVPGNWGSDEKLPKQIARDMRKMSNRINGELLGAVKAFEGRTGRSRPVVNCTTCHRGAVKPATNLGK